MSKAQMPFLHCRQLECLFMIHVTEFGMDLLEPESFESKEMYYCPLLEFGHWVIWIFNIFMMAPFANLSCGQSQDST
jgi:hypothetical protein